MRRAGYDVRVLPEEELGWEENPPTLIEFIRRDLRWCQGNMQYWRFLEPSRPQAGEPLSTGARDPDVHRLAGLDRHARARHAGGRIRRDARRSFIRPDAGMAAVRLVLVMWFAPKIASVIDILLQADFAARSAAPACSSPMSRSRPCSRFCCVRSCGSATRYF